MDLRSALKGFSLSLCVLLFLSSLPICFFVLPFVCMVLHVSLYAFLSLSLSRQKETLFVCLTSRNALKNLIGSKTNTITNASSTTTSAQRPIIFYEHGKSDGRIAKNIEANIGNFLGSCVDKYNKPPPMPGGKHAKQHLEYGLDEILMLPRGSLKLLSKGFECTLEQHSMSNY